jgi:hypothetical protein
VMYEMTGCLNFITLRIITSKKFLVNIWKLG